MGGGCGGRRHCLVPRDRRALSLSSSRLLGGAGQDRYLPCKAKGRESFKCRGGGAAAALMGCEGGVAILEIRFQSYSLNSRRTVRCPLMSGWTCSNWRVLLEVVLLH